MSFERGVHVVQPAAVTVTQASEMGTVYTASEMAALGEVAKVWGLRLHVDGARFANAVAAGNASAADDEAWDAEIRTRMDEGLALCGDDVGTPMLAFEDKFGVKQGYFGPVITRVPPTEDSLAMFDALVTMMDVQGFWELKRSRTERPEFGERP